MQSLLDLASGIEAVQLRHQDVQDDEIRLQQLGSRQQSPSVGDVTDDLAFPRQQPLVRFAKQPVIIREQDAWGGHDR